MPRQRKVQEGKMAPVCRPRGVSGCVCRAASGACVQAFKLYLPFAMNAGVIKVTEVLIACTHAHGFVVFSSLEKDKSLRELQRRCCYNAWKMSPRFACHI